MDPYFDKPAGPPRPLIGTGAVALVCGTVLSVAALAFAHEHPGTATEAVKYFFIGLAGVLMILKA